jgi:LysM repeat protein
MHNRLIKNILFPIVFGLIWTVSGVAQKNSIPVSEVRETIKGKEFYIHTVQKGQTLFSIATAYSVQNAEVAEFNEDVFDGLVPDQMLKIPIYKGRNNSMEEIRFNQVLHFHYVKKKETLYSIRHQYKVKEEVLLKWNPAVEDGLKDGMVLRIPKEGAKLAEAESELLTAKKDKSAENLDPSKYLTHVVESGETLFSISRMYSTPLDVILKLNPDAEDGLSIGEKLLIPKELTEVDKKAKETPKEPHRSMAAKALSSKPCKNDYRFNAKDTFDVALLLPFYLSENAVHQTDTSFINQEDATNTRNQASINPKSKVFLDFYEGFLLGMNEMKNRQLPLHLSVYDTHGRVDSLLHILKEPSMQEQDLVIGPVYENTLKEFNNFSKEYGIQFVSPLLSLSPEGEIKAPLLIQVIPTLEMQIKEFSDYLANLYDKNIVLIHFDTPQEKEVLAYFNKYLPQALKVKAKGSTIRFKVDIQNKDRAFDIYKPGEVADDHVVSHPLKRALRQDMENVVILISRDQGIVSNSIRELNMIVNEKNLTIPFNSVDFKTRGILRISTWRHFIISSLQLLR